MAHEVRIYPFKQEMREGRRSKQMIHLEELEGRFLFAGLATFIGP
jgi:hypothetical protein